MAGVTGLEPAASGVTGRRSNQLSYTPKQGKLPASFSMDFLAGNPKNSTKTSEIKNGIERQVVRPMVTYRSGSLND